MKKILFLSLLVAVVGCGSSKHVNMSKQNLDGSWVPVRQEFGGTILPAAGFEKQKLIVSGTHYTVIAESVDKGEATYKDGKMDIYGKEGVNAGKHFTAIYRYEHEELTICYNLSGEGYPESYETKGNKLLFLSVFRKE